MLVNMERNEKFHINLQHHPLHVFFPYSSVQGGMKRHGFKGMPASHGASLSHRSIGSTGQRDAPGKVRASLIIKLFSGLCNYLIVYTKYSCWRKFSLKLCDLVTGWLYSHRTWDGQFTCACLLLIDMLSWPWYWKVVIWNKYVYCLGSYDWAPTLVLPLQFFLFVIISFIFKEMGGRHVNKKRWLCPRHHAINATQHSWLWMLK